MQKILIGGISGSGKSTLASQLAQDLGISWVSTDQIRSILNIQQLKGDESLHLEREVEKSEEIWPGIERLICNPYPWEGVIVEGVAILPHLAIKFTDVKSIFLIDVDDERIRETLYQRSLLPWITTKTEEQQKAKADFISRHREYIKIEAAKYGLPVYSMQRTSDDIKVVKSLLGVI
jgi:2-phosphoglycerate kinase